MRILFDTTLFIAVVVAPLPLTLCLVAVGFFLFPRYIEPVVAGAIMELLYRGSGTNMFGTHVPLAALALVAFFVVETLRTVIRERRA